MSDQDGEPIRGKATIATGVNRTTGQVLLIVVSPSGLRTTIGLTDEEVSSVIGALEAGRRSLHPDEEKPPPADDRPIWGTC